MVVIEGLIVFAAAAWVFRFLGRLVGTAGTRKLFRSMPLTASFGILTILIYAFAAIFAGWLAPYGQEAILQGVAANIVPGGNPAMGGNPDYPLGTDQLGRDMLSRLNIRRAKHCWHCVCDDMFGVLYWWHLGLLGGYAGWLA